MKSFSNAMIVALRDTIPWPVDLVKVDISSVEDIYLTNHYHDIEVGSNTYLSAGDLLGFSNVSEHLEVKDNSLDLSLSGLDDAILSRILTKNIEGSKVTISRGFYNESTGKLHGYNDPDYGVYDRWSGRVHSYAIQDDYTLSNGTSDSNKITITLNCRSLLSTILQRQSGRFTSPQSFGTDKSMEFVPSLATFNPEFGKEK